MHPVTLADPKIPCASKKQHWLSKWIGRKVSTCADCLIPLFQRCLCFGEDEQDIPKNLPGGIPQIIQDYAFPVLDFQREVVQLVRDEIPLGKPFSFLPIHKKAVPYMEEITSLDLHGVKLGTDWSYAGPAEVVTAVKKLQSIPDFLPNIKELNLSRCGIHLFAGELLVTLIEFFPKLEILDLSNNALSFFTDETQVKNETHHVALCVLADLKNLKKLIISKNKLIPPLEEMNIVLPGVGVEIST